MRREHGSTGELLACQYLEAHGFEPVTLDGEIAAYVAGDPQSRLAFMAHIDTVHSGSDAPHQEVELNEDLWTLAESSCTYDNCLGADDAAGVAILLELQNSLADQVRFIIHRGEECGLIGAYKMIHHPWGQDLRWAISLDRKGTRDVVRTQRGVQTASDEFTEWLAERLSDEMGTPWSPADGVFTDSAAYDDGRCECTNLSVGYQRAHSPNESLEHSFVVRLCEALPKVGFENAPHGRGE